MNDSRIRQAAQFLVELPAAGDRVRFDAGALGAVALEAER